MNDRLINHLLNHIEELQSTIKRLEHMLMFRANGEEILTGAQEYARSSRNARPESSPTDSVDSPQP